MTYERLLNTAYEKYRLHWMMSHGHTIMELMSEIQDHWNNCDTSDLSKTETPIIDTFFDWEYGRGFSGGSIWVSKDEFEQAEFMDEEYMKEILSETECAEWTRLVQNKVG